MCSHRFRPVRGVAEQLKPYCNFLCKRLTFSDDYLPAFNRPNIALVDTDGQGVERITERGLHPSRRVRGVGRGGQTLTARRASLSLRRLSRKPARSSSSAC